MRVARTTALIVAVLLLTTVSTVAGFVVSPGGYLAPLASPPLAGSTGGIAGTISIGNVAPLCTGYPTTAPAPQSYNQIGLVITPSPSSHLPLTIPLNWVLINGCIVRATFTVGLSPGVYSLSITSCNGIHIAMYSPYNPFCAGLPKTVIVSSDTWTQVEIRITTGIY